MNTHDLIVHRTCEEVQDEIQKLHGVIIPVNLIKEITDKQFKATAQFLELEEDVYIEPILKIHITEKKRKDFNLDTSLHTMPFFDLSHTQQQIRLTETAKAKEKDKQDRLLERLNNKNKRQDGSI